MDIKQLVTFLHVAKFKNFTRASQELFITQPTVSNHIKSLEQQVNTQLFLRVRKQVVLTRAGHLFQRYAQRIVDEYTEMTAQIDRLAGSSEGRLNLFASSVPRRFLLPDLMDAFHKEHPEITFSVVDGDSRTIIDNLMLGDSDFGFTGSPPQGRQLITEPIASDNLVLITADPACQPEDGRAFTAKEIASLPFLLREEGSGTRAALEQAFQTAGIDPEKLTVRGMIEDTRSIVEMVRRGLGVAVISGYEADAAQTDGKLFAWPLSFLDAPRPLYFLYRTDMKDSPLHRLFVHFVRNYFRDAADGSIDFSEETDA